MNLKILRALCAASAHLIRNYDFSSRREDDEEEEFFDEEEQE